MRKIKNLILILLCHTICGCSILDKMGTPFFEEYEYDTANILGYGPVNHWVSLDFEKWLNAQVVALAHQKGFKTCWNNNSRPRNSNGCTYFAYHPSSTSDIGVAGGIIVVDHGQILRELSENGKDVFGPYDPIKVSNYAAKAHAEKRGFVHYGFGDEQVDFNTIKAIGSITKK